MQPSQARGFSSLSFKLILVVIIVITLFVVLALNAPFLLSKLIHTHNIPVVPERPVTHLLPTPTPFPLTGADKKVESQLQTITTQYIPSSYIATDPAKIKFNKLPENKYTLSWVNTPAIGNIAVTVEAIYHADQTFDTIIRFHTPDSFSSLNQTIADRLIHQYFIDQDTLSWSCAHNSQGFPICNSQTITRVNKSQDQFTLYTIPALNNTSFLLYCSFSPTSAAYNISDSCNGL